MGPACAWLTGSIVAVMIREPATKPRRDNRIGGPTMGAGNNKPSPATRHSGGFAGALRASPGADMIARLARECPGRSVAQPGSASAWGAEGREFESHRSDHSRPPPRRTEDAQGEAMNRPESDLEPWQYPEEHWRKLVERVRAGRPLRPAKWPGGARCA